MTVRVPNSGSDRDDREYGIARAKEFARGFSDLSPSLFPCAITPHQVVDGFDAACISARQCVYLLHHRLRLCLGVGG